MRISEGRAFQAAGTVIAGVLRQEGLGNIKEPRVCVDWAR